jgi:hypothetical protein
MKRPASRKPLFVKAQRVKLTRGPDKGMAGVVQAVSKGSTPMWLVTRYLVKLDTGMLVEVAQTMLEAE